MLLLVEGIMNGKGFGGIKWMHWFSTKLNHPLPPKSNVFTSSSPYDALLILLLTVSELEGGYYMKLLCCPKSHTVLALWIMFWIIKIFHRDNCVALRAKCVRPMFGISHWGVCHLLSSEHCLSLEYWGSVTASLQPVWSQSPELRNMGIPKAYMATLDACHGWSQNSYTPGLAIGLKCVHSEIIFRKLWNVTNSLKQLIKLGI